MEEVLTLIQTMGYPAAITILLLWYINKKDDAHRTEMQAMTDAVNNNTNVITKLYEHIVKGEKE